MVLGTGSVHGLITYICTIKTKSHGTYQGCSCLFFSHWLESLTSHFTLTAPKTSSALYGIKCEGTQYRVSPYADDLLLYLTDPEESILGILSILEKFCSSQAKKFRKVNTSLFTSLPNRSCKLIYELNSDSTTSELI